MCPLRNQKQANRRLQLEGILEVKGGREWNLEKPIWLSFDIKSNQDEVVFHSEKELSVTAPFPILASR